MSLPSFQLEWLELPDSELGLRVMALWLGYLAEKKGIAAHELPEDVAQYFVEQTPNFTSDSDPALERIMHVIANGDMERGGKIFREYMIKKALNMAALDEAVTGRRKQKANAQKPRNSALQAIIEDIVQTNPKIKHAELLAELRGRASDNGTISEVDEEEKRVYWRRNPADAAPRHTPFKGLYPLLSEAKKKVALPGFPWVAPVTN